MYSRMDFNTSPERCEAKPKKKYELSLKRGKQAIQPNEKLTDHKSEKKATLDTRKHRNDTADSTDSQNFMLRVSDSFVVEDTQDNGDMTNVTKAINFRENEIILISDSSEDEVSPKYELTRSKTSELTSDATKKRVTSTDNIYTIQSSDSENDNVRKGRGTWRADKPRAQVSAREKLKKCSITYTSDETVSDTESRNVSGDKENFSKTPTPAANIIPDSDESTFSFERMRGVLTENGRNIDESARSNSLKKTNERIKDFRKTPTENFRDRTESAKSLKEINRRIEEWRRTPEFSRISNNVTGSSKNLTESRGRIVESRKTPEFSKISRNESGSLNNLKEIAGIIEESRKNLEFAKISTKQTGSLNNLRETTVDKIEESQKVLEFTKVSKNPTESLKNGKESNMRIEESKKTPDFGRISRRDGEILKKLPETCRNIEEPRRTPISAKISSHATILSNKDVRNILKVIKSKRAVQSPLREYKKSSNLDNSDANESSSNDDELLSPESNVDSKNERKITNNVVIEETDSDSEDKIIRDSPLIDISKPYKTHVTRFLDPVANYDSPDCMSERKKLEIAHWLMQNTADTISESSISNVSASQKNSPSSGNSSLERLEMNYETPNNREKIRKKNTNEDIFAKNNPKNSTKSTKLRQTTIDNFVKKTEDGRSKIFTPVATITRKKVAPETNNVTDNLGIMDCADILDNLYGTEWRSKADDVLPSTEPRKKNILLRDKGVQTERKYNPKKKATKLSDSSTQEDEFDAFVRNIKPNLNSTKKPSTKPDGRKWNFIKDSSSSSSENCGDTTYFTALTNPRISNDLKINNRPTPLSVNTRRPIAICDTDTEDENDERIDNRKVLSFSNDESDTSTSEYDPNDVIPAKTTNKTHGASRSPRNIAKIPIIAKSAKIDKPKNTFIASLSPTISLDEAHPEAKKYRQDYKNTKEELCKYLHKLYNEKIFDNKLPSDMSIEWNVRMRGTAGFCYNKRSIKALGGVARSSRIVLATKILDTPDRLRDTLVHEMCHAAAWLINDVSDGHGPYWKAWAAKAMKAFPELPPIKRCHDYKITTKFTYRCTGCGYSVGRHSKSLDIEKKRCGHCYGKFELLINKVTKSGKIESRTPIAKKPSGFAMYVKENYSTVKLGRKGVQHKEVMQILGQQFSAIKISKKNDNSEDNNRELTCQTTED